MLDASFTQRHVNTSPVSSGLSPATNTTLHASHSPVTLDDVTRYVADVTVTSLRSHVMAGGGLAVRHQQVRVIDCRVELTVIKELFSWPSMY